MSHPTFQQDRVIIAFDLDCFYCQVEEHHNASLKDKPFAIQQKQIVVTCNYAARKLGIMKLQLISDAVRDVPNLIVTNGEDLTKYRAASKDIWNFMKDILGPEVQVERLGLDEIFVDVTNLIHTATTNERMISNSNTGIIGHCIGTGNNRSLILGSHVAQHIRNQLWEHLGYTCSAGVSVNKLLAKLVSTIHKPNQQTTLYASAAEEFLDALPVEKITGIGRKSLKCLRNHLNHTSKLTVGDVKQMCSLVTFSQLFNKDGSRFWDLLHGKDLTQVKDSPKLPAQISVEDTFPHINTFKQVDNFIFRLSRSLMARIHTELVENGIWMAYPRVLRISIRPTRSRYSEARKSKSTDFPVQVFSDSGNAAESLAINSRRLIRQVLKEPFDISLVSLSVSKFEKQKESGIETFLKRPRRDVCNTLESSSTFSLGEKPDKANTIPKSPEGFEMSEYKSHLETIGNDPNYHHCSRCDSNIFSWAKEAHELWHETEL